MGLPASYILPKTYNETYHLLGDGLVVPVVSWLEKELLYPLAVGSERSSFDGAALARVVGNVEPVQLTIEFRERLHGQEGRVLTQKVC